MAHRAASTWPALLIPLAATWLAASPTLAKDAPPGKDAPPAKEASPAAKEVPHDFRAVGAAVPLAPADPAIAHALAQISARRIQDTIETLVGFGTRHTLSSMVTDLPKGQGANAAVEWIESEFRRYADACGGCLEVKRDAFTEGPEERVPAPTNMTNVYAVLRGSDPAQAGRVLLVSGHYDSLMSDFIDGRSPAPGANDDASGVAVSLECARVLSKLKFPATIVFAAVVGEEQGLLGSRHLAKLAKSEGWQIEAVFNNDIVGGNTTPGDRWQDKSRVRIFSEGIPAAATPEQVRIIESVGYESDSPSRELARAILEASASYGANRGFQPVLELRRDRFLRGGDHSSFNAEGFAAVRFTEWREDFHHQHQAVRIESGVQYGDLLKFVDFHYVARVASVNAAGIATFAAAPGEPQQVQILTRALGNDSTLQWTAPEGAPAGTQYEVVWRETTASEWQRVVNTRAFSTESAGGNSITLPIAKDNVIFGMRSLDAQGHRSPAVVPWPTR
jgi:hypothetical protein